jgi:hypothetical protein
MYKQIHRQDIVLYPMPSIFYTHSVHLSPSSKHFFSKSLIRISLGPRVWFLVRATYLVLIGCSLSIFIIPWLLIDYDSLAAPCLKCKSALFTARWSLRRRLIRWRLMDRGSSWELLPESDGLCGNIRLIMIRPRQKKNRNLLTRSTHSLVVRLEHGSFEFLNKLSPHFSSVN